MNNILAILPNSKKFVKKNLDIFPEAMHI